MIGVQRPCSARWATLVAFLLTILIVAGQGHGDEPSQRRGQRASNVRASGKLAADPAKGRVIFEREWIANDRRSYQGDGLGPVFNGSSCVGCHNQGGVGGAGPRAKNVQLLTVVAKQPTAPPARSMSRELSQAGGNALAAAARLLFGGKSKPLPPKEKKKTLTAAEKQKKELAKELEQLAGFHPAFRTSRTIVVHRFATVKHFDAWRKSIARNTDNPFGRDPFADASRSDMAEMMMSSMGGGRTLSISIEEFFFVHSERNATALFGGGKIDRIPEQVILAGAKKRDPRFPEISGRVARLGKGRIGRFGWKAQKSNLSDFVLTACAVEIGLHVPGHHQGLLPTALSAKNKSVTNEKKIGLDLSSQQCKDLIEYVGRLPAPIEARQGDQVDAVVAAGKRHFNKLGCAACHTPDLGNVKGLYSDLLVHDMGPDLEDSGSYGVPLENFTEREGISKPLPSILGGRSALRKQITPQPDARTIGATRREWRTPPLWGVRDSAPYLHDGRAETLEKAILLHAGEAKKTRDRYVALSKRERDELITMLRSLVAPR